MHTAHLFRKIFTQEIKFLINVFAENGQSITVLEKVTKEYMNKRAKEKEKKKK